MNQDSNEGLQIGGGSIGINSSFLDILIVPLIFLAYYHSLQLSAMLNLSRINFYFILFLMIHIFSSIVFLFKGYESTGQWKPSIIIVGMGPTLVSLLTLFSIRVFPFLKWPFSFFSALPYYDLIIDPLIMGLSAYFSHLLLNKALLPSLYGEIAVHSQPDPIDLSATTHESAID
jgi:hypothetical protein